MSQPLPEIDRSHFRRSDCSRHRVKHVLGNYRLQQEQDRPSGGGRHYGSPLQELKYNKSQFLAQLHRRWRCTRHRGSAQQHEPEEN